MITIEEALLDVAGLDKGWIDKTMKEMCDLGMVDPIEFARIGLTMAKEDNGDTELMMRMILLGMMIYAAGGIK